LPLLLQLGQIFDELASFVLVVVEQQLLVASAAARQRMELGLTFLGTVGANAPFVGLLYQAATAFSASLE